MVIELSKEKEPCTSSSRNLARSYSCKKHKNLSRQACSFLEGNLRRLRRNTWEGKYDTREKNLSAVLANSSNNMEEMLYMKCGVLKSNEDMILALAGQFKQLSHEPENFSGS